MPSFYAERQLPLTPPEYNTGYQSNGCVSTQFPQQTYASHGLGRQDESGYVYNGRYGLPQASAHIHPSLLHQQHQQSFNHSAVGRYTDSVVGLPLPPVRSFDLPSAPAPQYHQQHDYRSQFESQHSQQQQPQPKAKEEKPVGGVSAQLDYDMDWMTDFVSDMAAKIVQPGKPSHDGFRSWVHGVLCATRLPAATIILSLHYLSRRMTMLQGTPHDGQIYRMLTVALIMGSKFLDDNTFINRSWADVSLIEVKTLNQIELEWLTSIDFRLHRGEDTSGFSEWQSCWKDWEAQALARGARSLKLSPLDTSVQHHSHRQTLKTFSPQSSQSAFPPPSAQDYSAISQQSHYHTPAYAPYDPWLIRRPANETSPASAPHTGPTTPEYYGGPGTWAPIDNSGAYNFSARPYGFTPLPQPRPQSHTQAPAAAYTPFTPQYHSNAWTNHPMHCNCGHCNRGHMNYFMAPNFGPQIIAA
ncbi:hypothetical protein EJ08DRAFT_669239 [Tothia fuscella]|uniref:Cyclin-like protein n=1 Tax=Tothia fuscella TaxID=1048955 RepID=A0A9P4NUX9_9PEZI|nr:hypothetical protein EJ08DRAFT_669239 [Tothia fuscella]